MDIFSNIIISLNSSVTYNVTLRFSVMTGNEGLMNNDKWYPKEGWKIVTHTQSVITENSFNGGSPDAILNVKQLSVLI